MRCIAVLAFVSLLIVVPCCRHADPADVPSDLAFLSAHLSYPEQRAEKTATTTTYNVDLDFPNARGLVLSKLQGSGWKDKGITGQSGERQSETFEKLPQATVILTAEPNVLYRDHNRTAVTIEYISRKSPNSDTLVSQSSQEQARK